jgi:hypothetical protein
VSLETISDRKPGRVYRRAFDHDEARELYATGLWSQSALAERFGVSRAAVGRVLNPRRREAMARHSKEWVRKTVASRVAVVVASLFGPRIGAELASVELAWVA